VSDSKIPKDLKYTNEHEWVRIEGALATVGLTDYAQQKLGDITYVDMPEVGKQVEQAGEMCVVESVKAAADVYAPLAGVVAEVNPALEDEPALVNRDCYGKGWLVKLNEFAAAGLDNLMDAAAYGDFLAQGE